MSSFATFLADNIYFDKRHISSIEFKPFIRTLMFNEMKQSADVYEVFVDILEKNYPDHSEQEYKKLYDDVFGTGRIDNFGIELLLRSQKIKEIQDNIELKKHNEIMESIESTTTIKELEEIKLPDLMELIQNNMKNDVVATIPKRKLGVLMDLIYNQEDDLKINKELIKICKSYKLSKEDTNNMHQQLVTILDNKKIKYTVIEIKKIEEQTKRIYLQNHLKTLEQINGALELNQLPKNFGESVIRIYLSVNSKTDVSNYPIPPYEFDKFVDLLLIRRNLNDKLVTDELKVIVDRRFCNHDKATRNKVVAELMENFNMLDRLYYFIEEVSLYNKRVNEFTGTKCIKMTHYGYEIKRQDSAGGLWFVLFGNELDNMDYNAIKHESDYDSFKEHIKRLSPTTDFYGSACYKRSYGLKLYNSNGMELSKTSSLDDLLALKEQILKEKEEQLKAVDEEIAKYKRRETKGNNNGK